MGEEVLRSVTPGQQIVKIFHDELTTLLGGDAAPLDLTKPPASSWSASTVPVKQPPPPSSPRLLKSQGRAPQLIACDLHRPAAIAQLATLAEQVGVPVISPGR